MARTKCARRGNYEAESLPKQVTEMKYTAVFQTLTQAKNAQRAIAAAAVFAETVKVSQSDGRGCAWGVSFPRARKNDVESILKSAGIRAREYIEE